MNIGLLEKACLKYFAELLNLQIDKEIFLGQLPVSCKQGSAVIWTNKTMNSINDELYSFQIISRYLDRDVIMDLYSTLFNNLPMYGVTIDNFQLLTVNLDGNGGVYRSNHDGIDYWAMSLNLSIIVKPTN
jgi:hypothetical protein